ncbi:hypothetical protein P873_09560 [Arenimonas composti TR7-09 = DSM 18010]|uniref:Medium/long-chain acyl-CoA thioesterase YigI n=2 Tax=Arenimonas TaxID=490567 RepID=A0A091BE23_9GAMM|nr:hypothetical protein P873_09560 [Arenimonas composti TR7-09 = DSM 18010]
MPIALDDARRILDSQPFSRLLGAELTAFAADAVELRIPLRPELLQQFGFAHGGLIAYAADNALTFAGGAALGPSVLTAEFKINFLRPVKGEVLVARAAVVHAGRRQAVCRCELFVQDDAGEHACAVALGTIVAFGPATEA